MFNFILIDHEQVNSGAKTSLSALALAENYSYPLHLIYILHSNSYQMFSALRVFFVKLYRGQYPSASQVVVTTWRVFVCAY